MRLTAAGMVRTADSGASRPCRLTRVKARSTAWVERAGMQCKQGFWAGYAQRRTCGLILTVLFAILVAPLSANSEPAVAPLSAAERQMIYKVLTDGPRAIATPLAALDDSALERAVLEYARAETGQRLRPSAIDRLWSLQPATRDLAAEFAAVRTEGRLAAWLNSLPPADPRYAALSAAWRDYAAMVAKGGWSRLPSDYSLRPGQSDPRVVMLRERLTAEGYRLASTPTPETHDTDLQAALVRFQRLHGLEPDGVVGPQTRRALDVSADARLAQIDASLERMRWTPRQPPPRRLEVNVGAAEATLFEAGEPVLSMRIIVGDLKHKTPMFASQIESIVFNPPWNVPASIASEEILPKAARDPGYLARHRFTYVEGRLQQRPGPANALGRVKFDLPSPFGVYLHDTPGKSAFARPIRTLSHGCMRLERPRELAAYLLETQGWTATDIDIAIATDVTRRVGLERPLPLYVIYQTAFVDASGLNLRPDPYRWDEALAKALAGYYGVAANPQGATECAEARTR